jgi:predicted ATPase
MTGIQMTNKISLNFGRTPAQPPLEFELKPLTVFIGPNNSGKSRILFEIMQYCHSGNPNIQKFLLKELIFSPLSDAAIEAEATKFSLMGPQGFGYKERRSFCFQP